MSEVYHRGMTLDQIREGVFYLHAALALAMPAWAYLRLGPWGIGVATVYLWFVALLFQRVLDVMHARYVDYAPSVLLTIFVIFMLMAIGGYVTLVAGVALVGQYLTQAIRRKWFPQRTDALCPRHTSFWSRLHPLERIGVVLAVLYLLTLGMVGFVW